ncbi:putative short transient receptor potential channel 3 isoform X2 [Apostichopus japonicus]|uniref:Putative short transient receptor potential channel 3 isoform X2 n=1 Tax=Stichopus japonicus TaxID=307972 RepID=A0A2G8JCZ8_STIJA|nr:putative short transient receptor potential channel 3 isoform X2 [Apostichopus japonicus]
MPPYRNRPPEERGAILKCKSVTTDIHPDVTPIIRAAQKNNFTLVKILHDAGLRVEELIDDDLTMSTNDSLQRSVGTLEIYRALASPAYVCFDPDPIGRAFHMSSLLRKLALLEVEFKLTYLELANGMEQYAADIISYTVTTEEAMAVLAYNGQGNSGKSERAVKALGLLPTLNRAIAHDQKKFVAEPTCQHVLRVQFSRQLISLQDRHFVFSVFLRILIILLFPVICIVYKLGISETCNDFANIPIVKFFMQLGSDLLLLGLILYETVLDSKFGKKELPYYGKCPPPITAWHYMIYVYALGMLWREILYLWKKRHQRNVVQLMNVINIIIGVLLMAFVNNEIAWIMFSVECQEIQYDTIPTTTATRSTANFPNPRINYTGLNDSEIIEGMVNDLFQTAYLELDNAAASISDTLRELLDHKEETTNMNFHWIFLLSRSIMSLVVVFSFTRIQPFFITVDMVGPLSISFTSMFTTTGQFLSVVIAVLSGFASGLTFIYHDTYHQNDVNGQSSCTASGGRGGSCSDTNYYENLPQSMLTLYWSLFGLIPAKSVKMDSIPRVLESMGELLYASFYVFTVLVLLNALIAVMSNVYNVVEENADTEWKFHRTYLWMSFLDETFTVPPPFNLLPNCASTIKNTFRRIKRCYCCLFSRKQSDENNVTSHRDEIRVTSTLVERYIAERTSHERKLEGDITLADMRNLKNDVIGLRYNLFKEVWCINEKLQTGHTESDHINTEMTTVQDVFNALATNKEDFHNFETSVRKWLKNMVERLRNLPDIDQMAAILRSGGGGQSIRRPIASSVDEMVNYYETLKRHKTRRKRTNQLLKELME